MGALRKQMEADMVLRGLADRTRTWLAMVLRSLIFRNRILSV